MSQWTARVQDHRVWALMTGLGSAIDQAVKLDDIAPDAVDALERLRSILSLSGKRLGGSDPLTVLPAPLDGLASSFEAQKSEIDAFISDHNAAHLNNANSQADSALANYLPQVPGVASSEEMIGLVQSVASYRSALEDQERLSLSARQSAKSQIEELTSTLGTFRTQTQATIADLRAQLDNERQKISAQAIEQQKLFADAQQSRSNSFNETLLKVQENLAKTLTDQQGQFSGAQENRGREFATAQTDSQKRFGDLIADYTKRLADQDAEFTRQRDAFAGTAQSQLTALTQAYELAAKGILDQVDKHRKDVEKLVGVIGNLGVTSGYQTTANSARKSMWVWQSVAVVAMLGLIGFAFYAFLPAMKGGFTWEGFAMRAFLTVTVGVLAAYAANQADRFFQMEKYNRKLALELAAIDPFIALFPEEEQHKFKLEIGRRSFAQEETSLAHTEKSPATTLDVLLSSKQSKEVLQLLIDAAQKTLKGG
jgi:hypothetical protein